MSISDEYYGPSPITDKDIILQLGRVTAAWGTVDFTLVELLCRLLNDDPAGEIIYFTLGSFKSRLDVITNIVTELMDDADLRKQELLKRLNRISDLSRTRNEMVHSAMTLSEDNKVIRSVRRPGRETPHRWVHVNASDMAQHAQAVGHVITEITGLMDPSFASSMVEFLSKEGLLDVERPVLDIMRQLAKDGYPLRKPTTGASQSNRSSQTRSDEKPPNGA